MFDIPDLYKVEVVVDDKNGFTLFLKIGDDTFIIGPCWNINDAFKKLSDAHKAKVISSLYGGTIPPARYTLEIGRCEGDKVWITHDIPVTTSQSGYDSIDDALAPLKVIIAVSHAHICASSNDKNPNP